jgi:hypothetical protein
MTTHGEAERTESGSDPGEQALAGELEGVDPGELARAAARFAQENPHTALAGAFAVGFLLGGGLTPRLLFSLAAFAGRKYAAQAVREALADAALGEVEATRA